MYRLIKWALAHNVRLAAVILLANILFVAASSISLAEERNPVDVTIELEQGRLRLNGHEIVMPSSIEPWVEALGSYSRERDLGRKSYFWDDLGIRALTNSTGQIYDFTMYFRKIPEMEWLRERSSVSENGNTENCFVGTFILNGVELNATMPLWEYNHKVKNNRFSEDYIPILYRIPGGKIPDTNHSFGLSARVGPDQRVYRIEVYYLPTDCSSPLEDEEKTQHSHVEILKSELKNAADSVKRRLGITPKPDSPKTGEENK